MAGRTVRRLTTARDRSGSAGGHPSGETVLVVEQDGHRAGTLHLVVVEDGHAHVRSLEVDPEHRRAGHGRALLEAALDAARAADAIVLSLATRRTAPWQRAWVERAGFEIVDPPPSSLAEILTDGDEGDEGDRVVALVPLHPPVEPRLAVSVVPVRDGPDGLEVYVQHRASTMDFAAGAVVFPGGRVDPVDRAAVATHPATGQPATEPPGSEDVWASTSVGLAADPAGEQAVLRAAAVRELAEETGLTVAVTELLPWDWWVTPVGSPKRFDTYFFVLDGAGRALRNITTEAVTAGWEPVARLLARAAASEVRLMTPTRVILAELAELGRADQVLGHRPVIGDGRRSAGVRPTREPG